MFIELDLDEIDGFDWDEANITKNELKHQVFYKECEQVFLSRPLYLKDEKHSTIEKRYICLGKTEKGRILFISFTMRNLKVRVISARSADRKEKEAYEKVEKIAKI